MSVGNVTVTRDGRPQRYNSVDRPSGEEEREDGPLCYLLVLMGNNQSNLKTESTERSFANVTNWH